MVRWEALDADSSGAGRFIEMTHAAIECAVVQIVSECRALLQRGLSSDPGNLLRAAPPGHFLGYLNARTIANSRIGETLRRARESALPEWLDENSRKLELDCPVLQAGAGLGDWVNSRALSDPCSQPCGPLGLDGRNLAAMAHGGLHASIIIAYAEGLALLTNAPTRLNVQFDIQSVLRYWRGGLSFRARLLDDIQAAYRKSPGLRNLLSDPHFSESVMALQELLRHAVWQADDWGLSTPALAASLVHLDTCRDAWATIA